MALTWKVATRQWNKEKKKLAVKPATRHPLEGVKDYNVKPTGSANEKKMKLTSMAMDPLSAVLDGPDPLSDLLGATDPLSAPPGTQASQKAMQDTYEVIPSQKKAGSWDQTRASLVTRFPTTATLTFTSSFLQPSDSGVVKTQTAITERHRSQGMSGSERIRARLEQLDSLDEVGGGSAVREVGGLTQEEFTSRLAGLKLELIHAWQTDQRVKALKIAIQCVKLLSLSAPEHFYPHKFALVMEILECLATLVYERLKVKSKTDGWPMGGSEAGRLEAQETARNWLYKVASIRELLPRIYLEIALLPCYTILNPQEGEQALARLSRMIRGVGDPLLAAYVRMFMCKVGAEVAPSMTQYISETVEDFLTALKQGLWVECEADVNNGEDKEKLAARILSPPLQWMIQCLALRAPDHVLQSVLRQCEGGEGLGQALLVTAVLIKFPPHFNSQHAVALTHLIAGCLHPGRGQHELLCDLGRCVTQVAPPQHTQLQLLNVVWKLVTKIDDIKDYLTTAGVWLEFTAKHFTVVEVNTLLGDVLKHVGNERGHDQGHYPLLLALVTTALTNSPEPQQLFTMSHFQGVLSVFQREGVGSGEGVTRGVVEALLMHHPGVFTDPTLVQHLLTFCAALHDSINALTTDDERRQLSQLITSFIRQVNFGNNFEQQLDFYVNARAAFSNLDSVLVALVQCVCQLAMATLVKVRGQHSGKTGAFVRACAAYCFITVPSITSPSTRLSLYLLSANVALLNNCLGQGDACLKAAIREVLEVTSALESDPSTTDTLRPAIANLSSFLIAAPDAPDASPPLYLLRGLTNALRSYAWPRDSDTQAHLSIALLGALSAACQDTLPYHIRSVESNDTLYGGDPQVRQEAEQLASLLLQDILTHIKGLSGIQEKRGGPIARGLFWCIVTWCDLTLQPSMNLATLVWSLVLRLNPPQAVKAVSKGLQCRASILKHPELQELVKICRH